MTADEGYIRESITNPQAKLVAGFGPIMPTFQGQLTEDQLVQLVAYIKSLSAASGGTQTPSASPGASPAGTQAGSAPSPTQNIR